MFKLSVIDIYTGLRCWKSAGAKADKTVLELPPLPRESFVTDKDSSSSSAIPPNDEP